MKKGSRTCPPKAVGMAPEQKPFPTSPRLCSSCPYGLAGAEILIQRSGSDTATVRSRLPILRPSPYPPQGMHLMRFILIPALLLASTADASAGPRVRTRSHYQPAATPTYRYESFTEAPTVRGDSGSD